MLKIDGFISKITRAHPGIREIWLFGSARKARLVPTRTGIFLFLLTKIRSSGSAEAFNSNTPMFSYWLSEMATSFGNHGATTQSKVT